jgi:GntR family transcriptional regulator
MQWNKQQPIFQQLKNKVSASILDGSIKEGESVPSIRQLSALYEINPITVSKAYQVLVDDDIIEKQRGRGMFVKVGAKKLLLKIERKRFIKEEWPHVKEKINQLGLELSELMK